MPSLSVGSKDLSTKLVHAFLSANGGAPEQRLNVENSSEEESAITLDSGETVQGPNTVAVHLATLYKDAGLLTAAAEEEAEIHQWLSFSAKAEVMPELFKDLDEHLMTRTYLVKEQLTVADLVVFARVYTSFATLSTRQRFTLPALTRWFDLIQHSVPLIPEMPPVDVEVEAPVALAVDRESRLSKKSADKAKKGVSAERAKTATAEGGKTGENKKGEKTEKGAAAGDEKNTDKKANKKDGKGAKAEKKKDVKPQEAVPPLPGAIGGCVPSQLDLRVGRIVECEKHADADSLYVEKIECGEEEPRTVVSGLVKHIPLEEMQGRAVIIMANLKPVAMRGVKSMAMVMCATSAEGKVEILAPPKGSKPGDRVYFEGYEDLLPEPQLNPKKKIFETLAPTLKTDESRRARWIDAEGKSHLMLTNTGVCEAPTAVNALIK